MYCREISVTLFVYKSGVLQRERDYLCVIFFRDNRVESNRRCVISEPFGRKTRSCPIKSNKYRQEHRNSFWSQIEYWLHMTNLISLWKQNDVWYGYIVSIAYHFAVHFTYLHKWADAKDIFCVVICGMVNIHYRDMVRSSMHFK